MTIKTNSKIPVIKNCAGQMAGSQVRSLSDRAPNPHRRTHAKNEEGKARFVFWWGEGDGGHAIVAWVGVAWVGVGAGGGRGRNI